MLKAAEISKRLSQFQKRTRPLLPQERAEQDRLYSLQATAHYDRAHGFLPGVALTLRLSEDSYWYQMKVGEGEWYDTIYSREDCNLAEFYVEIQERYPDCKVLLHETLSDT